MGLGNVKEKLQYVNIIIKEINLSTENFYYLVCILIYSILFNISTIDDQLYMIILQ